MKLTCFWRRTTACLLVSTLAGCGSPVVDPGRPTNSFSPPVATPPPVNSIVLPSSDVEQVPTESILKLPIESNSAIYHSVKDGETLTSIAKQYGIGTERLRKANGLDASAALKSQQLLYIPQDR